MKVIFISAFALLLAKYTVAVTDYCSLCEGKHTMCLFKKGPSDKCIGYQEVTFTSTIIKYIVDVHNDIRNHVASGQEHRGALGGQPPASNMMPLAWDNELAEMAQRWVDQCVQIEDEIQHDFCRATSRFDVGQNILTAVNNDEQSPELAVLILNWYKQVLNVIPSDIDHFVGKKRGKVVIGQYSQLVWAQTQFVGCAMARYQKAVNFTGPPEYLHRFVCNYGPRGNVMGSSIYEKGTPCSACPYKKCQKLRKFLCLIPDKSSTRSMSELSRVEKNLDRMSINDTNEASLESESEDTVPLDTSEGKMNEEPQDDDINSTQERGGEVSFEVEPSAGDGKLIGRKIPDSSGGFDGDSSSASEIDIRKSDEIELSKEGNDGDALVLKGEPGKENQKKKYFQGNSTDGTNRPIRLNEGESTLKSSNYSEEKNVKDANNLKSEENDYSLISDEEDKRSIDNDNTTTEKDTSGNSTKKFETDLQEIDDEDKSSVERDDDLSEEEEEVSAKPEKSGVQKESVNDLLLEDDKLSEERDEEDEDGSSLSAGQSKSSKRKPDTDTDEDKPSEEREDDEDSAELPSSPKNGRDGNSQLDDERPSEDKLTNEESINSESSFSSKHFEESNKESLGTDEKTAEEREEEKIRLEGMEVESTQNSTDKKPEEKSEEPISGGQGGFDETTQNPRNDMPPGADKNDDDTDNEDYNISMEGHVRQEEGGGPKYDCTCNFVKPG